MTQSGKSLFYFGIYALGAGLLFLTIPDKLVSLMQLPEIPAAWGRVIGLLSLVIGTYDVYCGKANIQPFIKISVYTRFGFALGAILLFTLGQMPISILLLGGVDALGGLWTMMALKSESTAK